MPRQRRQDGARGDESQRRAGERKQEALDEQLPDDRARVAPSASRVAISRLARETARQQETGHARTVDLKADGRETEQEATTTGGIIPAASIIGLVSRSGTKDDPESRY